MDYSANGHYSQITYGYDKSGRIIHTAESAKDVMYRYDSLGRVVREDNEPLGRTFLYDYNLNGNIKTVKTFNYTVSAPQTPLDTLNYIYESGRPDHLIKLVSLVNGELAIGSYDSAGNPRAYKGAALSWNKNGTLKSYTKGAQSLSFRYDASGIRQEKIVNGVSHNYITFGSRILGEQYSGHNLSYYYDATGICGLRHNGLASYYFQKNIQGDVIRILDASGAVVARYDYDAWGNHKIYAKINGNYLDITNSGLYNNHIARINPFRYRGYYFDVETGWYYLESRYYDPSLRRFISADDPSIAVGAQSGIFGGLNPYSYCVNDPVNHADPTGRIVGTLSVIFSIIGLVISVAGLVYAVCELVNAWKNFIKEPSWANAGMIILARIGILLSILDVMAAFKAVQAALEATNLLSTQIAQSHEYWGKVGKSADTVDSETILTQMALDARDSKVDEIATWSYKERQDVTTVVAGYNKSTKQVAVGVNVSSVNHGKICAEDIVVAKLGGIDNIDDIVMTPAIRPRNGTVIPVCSRCQAKYPRSSFMSGTTFN